MLCNDLDKLFTPMHVHLCLFMSRDCQDDGPNMKEQEESSIKFRNKTKYTILMNFMVVILNRGLDSNNQLLSDDST